MVKIYLQLYFQTVNKPTHKSINYRNDKKVSTNECLPTTHLQSQQEKLSDTRVCIFLLTTTTLNTDRPVIIYMTITKILAQDKAG